jgi:hypothetical protein
MPRAYPASMAGTHKGHPYRLLVRLKCEDRQLVRSNIYILNLEFDRSSRKIVYYGDSILTRFSNEISVSTSDRDRLSCRLTNAKHS